jgi:hypothetical protein
MQAFHADFEFGENHYQRKDIWMVQHGQAAWVAGRHERGTILTAMG